MIFPMIRIMSLRLLRDRGAFTMAFLLPGVIYIIFAAIFASTTSGDVNSKVGLVAINGLDDDALVQQLMTSPSLKIVTYPQGGRELLEEKLRAGKIDAGIILRDNLETALSDSPIVVLSDAGRPLAAIGAVAEIERIIGEQAPERLIRRQAAQIGQLTGGFSEDQNRRLTNRTDAFLNEPAEDRNQRQLIDVQTLGIVGANAGALAAAAYYAGAVASMFVLFAAAQGAHIIHEERASGISNRLLIGFARIAEMTCGRFLFLTGLGLLQCAVIFTIAGLVFHIPVQSAVPELLVISLAMSSASAAFGLAIVSLFSTSQQAHAAASFAVLMISAIGGSMAPRYLMPEWLQAIGVITPNSWAIDAYYRALIAGDNVVALGNQLLLLTIFAGVVFALAVGFTYLKTVRHDQT